jgi:hypothetical protein
MTALFSREEGGERVQTQVDNLPNEHGGSSISGFGLILPLEIESTATIWSRAGHGIGY